MKIANKSYLTKLQTTTPKWLGNFDLLEKMRNIYD